MIPRKIDSKQAAELAHAPPGSPAETLKCDHGDLCPGHASPDERPCCYGDETCEHVAPAAQPPQSEQPSPAMARIEALLVHVENKYPLCGGKIGLRDAIRDALVALAAEILQARARIGQRAHLLKRFAAAIEAARGLL